MRQMLSETTISQLATLNYRADAQRRVWLVPLGSIYWEDEMPDVRQFVQFSEDDRNQILRLFRIRFKIWDDEPLSEDDRQLWNGISSQVPNWALFHRLDLSADDRRAREEAEQAVAKEWESLLEEADEVTIGQGDYGFDTVSATFNLTKGQAPDVKKNSWWRRLLGLVRQRL
jgi:hypothetical protein